MAGNSWDRMGRMEAAFESVAPVLRAAARAAGARVEEYVQEDPVWRLQAPAGSVDVAWSEQAPDAFELVSIWREGGQIRRGEVRRWTIEQPASDLEQILSEALGSLPEPNR
ncbi:MAG TPA: hypothetical protein VNI34_08415 [Candidatus Nitrosotalea sp.]|nr:hypothetical protein [Candidatus Nitrosotalea sp.]